MKTLFENQSLHFIINSILTGIDYIDELIIINKSIDKYKQIIIKPCIIDITNELIQVVKNISNKPENVETDLLEFICFTKDEDVFVNMSLSELIVIDKNILDSTGWYLIDYNESNEIDFNNIDFNQNIEP